MTAFLLRMPAGIPGECTRGWGNSIIETQIITPSGTTGAPTAYGVPLVVDSTAGNVGRPGSIPAGVESSSDHQVACANVVDRGS